MLVVRRHRFLAALVVMAATLSGNAYLDYRLILDNPAELQAMVLRTLDTIAPDYQPTMGIPEVSLRERLAVIRDLTFHEKGQSGRTLFRVKRVEAVFDLVPPALRRVTLIEPEVTIRIDAAGNLNFETGAEVSGSRPQLGSDLAVRIVDGRLRLVNEMERPARDLVLDGVTADLQVTRDLQVVGTGGLRLGALFDPADPLAGDGRPLSRLGRDLRFRPVFPDVRFEVERRADESVHADVELGRCTLSPLVRSIIPNLFQDAVWDELQPGGGVQTRLRVDHRAGEGLHVSASIRPRGARVRPRGFAMPITGIEGAFEVAVALDPDHPEPGPRILGVSWQNVTGDVGPLGRVRSRGAAFPGGANENLTLYVYVDARDIPLGQELEDALPPDIRAVYRRFTPRGSIGHAHVQVFKGPFVEEPQISVHVAELGGTVSAAYREYPVELEGISGTFQLREGANVEIHARGRFGVGGQAEVDAMVVHGDLIHVDVRGEGLPLGPQVVASLSPAVREFVEPFRPDGGLADFHLRVSKPRPDALPVPVVTVELRDALVRPPGFPLALTTSGRIRVDPIFPAGAREEDDPAPESVRLDLDLRAAGGPVTAAVVSGALTLSPATRHFEGDLGVEVGRLELDPELLAGLPAEAREVARVLGPTGAVRDLALRIGGPRRLAVRGRGDGLRVTPAEFPYPLEVTAFALRREGELLELTRVDGRQPAGGRLAARGEVLLGPGDGSPTVALDIEGEELVVEPALLAALPAGAARDQLQALRPGGRTAARLQLGITPELGLELEGELALEGVTAHVDRLHPLLARLRDEPARDLRGLVRLEPDRVTLEGLEGQLLGGQLVVSGTIETGPPRGPTGRPEEPPAAADPPLSLAVFLSDLELDARKRQLLATPELADTLAQFPADGPLEVGLRLERGRGGGETDARVTLRPRGLTVRPRFLPLPITDLSGAIEIAAGEPARIELTGRLAGAPLTIGRDLRAEGEFPAGGAAGRVFALRLDGFQRPPEGPERDLFERDLDPAVADLIEGLDPTGPLDVEAFVYVPRHPRAAITWVAEARLGGFGCTPGVRLDDLRGVVQASGRLAEFRLGSCQGEVVLERGDWKKQTFTDLRGQFRLEEGVFTFGARGAPFVASLYGGDLAGVVEYLVRERTYRGWLGLRDARLGPCMDQLGELREGPSEGGNQVPYTGDLSGSLAFYGGGQLPDGRERRLAGEGWMHLRESNLIEVGPLDTGRIILDAIKGENSRPYALETMHMEFALQPDRIRFQRVQLNGPGITVVGDDGYLKFNGDIELDLVPFDTGGGIWQDILVNASPVPFTAYKVSGKVWEARPRPLPIYSGIERLVRLVFPGDEDDEDADDEEDE